jgi:hypothetical protein
MATTFIGVEVPPADQPNHAVVALRRRKSQVDLYDWSCTVASENDLLEYLAAVAGRSGVIAVHDPSPEAGTALMKRLWRVLDYRQSVALAPRLRTRALVRVAPTELAQSLCGDASPLPLKALERLQSSQPGVDFLPIIRAVRRSQGLPGAGPSAQSLLSAALAAYAALWCWWHGPAGYDVLGESSDRYRLAPRVMDLEPDPDATLF